MLGISTEGESASSQEDLELVAEDLIAGVKAGDAGMVARALRTAHLVCSNYEEAPSSPSRSFDKSAAFGGKKL